MRSFLNPTVLIGIHDLKFKGILTLVIFCVSFPLYVVADTLPSGYPFLAKAIETLKQMNEFSVSDSSSHVAEFDSLESIQRQKPDFETAFHMTIQIGGSLLEKGFHIEALGLYNSLIDYLSLLPGKSAGNEQKKALVYNVIGAVYEETGAWDEAIDYYIRAMHICDSLDWDEGIAMVSNNLGNVYYSKHDLERARQMFEEALSINKKSGKRKELFNNYNNLAAYYINIKAYDKALNYALLALEQIDRQQNPYLLMFIYDNIGGLYTEMKNYPLSLSYLNMAKNLGLAHGYEENLAGTYIKIAHAFLEFGSRDSGRYYLARAENLSRKIDNPSIISDVRHDLYLLYGNLGDYKTAYSHFNEYISLRDSLDEINSRQKFERLKAVYEVGKKEQENLLLKQKVDLQSMKLGRHRIIIGGILIISLLLCVLLIFFLRKRHKERSMNQQLALQQQALHRQEKEILLQQDKELKQNLDYKNRQLTSYTLQLIRNNEFSSNVISELQKLLLELNPRDTEKRDHLKKIMTSFRQFVSGHDWEEFRLYFEEVHQSFYDILSQKYPDLTPNEKKLCAFLRLGLSNKEIASIIFRELRSIESARNRLRKKMNLDTEVNLINHLSQF
jgi:tetratricopeptide (TPR) repeat protein